MLTMGSNPLLRSAVRIFVRPALLSEDVVPKSWSGPALMRLIVLYAQNSLNCSGNFPLYSISSLVEPVAGSRCVSGGSVLGGAGLMRSSLLYNICMVPGVV